MRLRGAERGSRTGFIRSSSWPLCLAVWGCAFALADEPTPPVSVEQQRADFTARMQDVVLDGFFVVDSPTADKPALQAERYEIRQVQYLGSGDLWQFDARLVYSTFDVTVPLPLPVHWAGETPVITVDSVTIPGLGTFNARVVIDGDRYAGTWQHGEVGGHLFGRIRPKGAAE